MISEESKYLFQLLRVKFVRHLLCHVMSLFYSNASRLAGDTKLSAVEVRREMHIDLCLINSAFHLNNIPLCYGAHCTWEMQDKKKERNEKREIPNRWRNGSLEVQRHCNLAWADIAACTGGMQWSCRTLPSNVKTSGIICNLLVEWNSSISCLLTGWETSDRNLSLNNCHLGISVGAVSRYICMLCLEWYVFG